ncbi:MAG: glycosyltransferase family 2 protein [Planctomycetota bacterium]|jgi:cellulose synthase/poly-beta-1,6-N-acetylglucosamine synthase-like glycosyltransferase
MGYPLILFFWSLLRRKNVKKSYIYPPVSVIIAALNEEKYIQRKIDNLLNQDYPSNMIEIIVVSDGSVDNTETIVRSLQESNRNIRLYLFDKRRGKASALNIGVSKAKGQVIVFTDARQIFKVDTVKELVANFNDPSVGAASGELFLDSGSVSRIVEPLNYYWNYEKWIRKFENKIDSVIGVTGAVYAIRKYLFEPISDKTILDDLLIPMKVVFKGYRVVFDEKAIAYDDASINSKKEMRRKIRTLSGNFQLLSLMPEILSYGKNRLFFNYFSHKITRLIAPMCFITLFLSNIILFTGFYLYFLMVQGLFYFVALSGLFIDFRESKHKYFYIPYAFLMFNYATFLGFVNFITKNDDIWHKE